MLFIRAFGTAALVTALLAATGCDTATGKADKQIQQNITTAAARMNGTTEDRAQAEALLSSLPQQTDASPAPRIDVQELRAQLQLKDAQQLQPQIDRNKADILRLVWEMNELAAQIQSDNALAAELAKYDPATIQASLSKSITQVQGSADQPQWIKTDSASIPSLAAITANISSLQNQITEVQGTIKTLSDQRAAQAAQADRFNQESEKSSGAKSVDLYKQGAEAQKRGEELSVQIDVNTVKLSRAQTDLDIALGQQKALTSAVQDLTAQSDQSAGIWKTLQQQIEDQKAQAIALLGDPNQAANPNDPTGGTTLASKAAALTEKLKDQRALREEAENHLNNASDFFKEAGQTAMTLQSNLQTKVIDPKNQGHPDIEAWKDQSATMHPARYRLQEAIALDRQASEAASRAAEAAAVQQLATTLKPMLAELGQQLPPVLQDSDGKLAADIKTGRELADTSYQAADEALKGIIEGTAPEDQKHSARLADMTTQYGWYLLASSVGDQAANSHLDEAKAQRDEILQNGSDIKGLPADLTPPPAPATPAAH